MAWNDPVNDKKWTDEELQRIFAQEDNVNTLIKIVKSAITSILDTDALTFLKPLDRLELLQDLRETLDKLDNAKTTIGTWLHSPDVFKP